MLEIKNLHHYYGKNHVLKGINITAHPGKILGFLGRNGEGKTTTIRLIMDVLDCKEGEILYNGEKFNVEKISTGYLPEEKGMYTKLPVYEQMIYFGMLKGMSRKDATQKTEYWLKRLGYYDRRKEKLENFSKGNKQKIQIAMTVMNEPEVLILDEPFSGLDPVNMEEISNIILENAARGALIIFSSHQMGVIEEFCEDVVIIHDGKVVLSGNLDEIRRIEGENAVLIKTEYKEAIYEKFGVGNCKEIKEGIIVKGIKFNDLLKDLSQLSIDMSAVEIYRPKLQDIFISKVGERYE